MTGAGSGIGRATAHALADGGAAVLCTDIDGATAEKTAAECAERATQSGRAAHRSTLAAHRLPVTVILAACEAAGLSP